MMEPLAKIFNSSKLLTVFAKSSIIDNLQYPKNDFEYSDYKIPQGRLGKDYMQFVNFNTIKSFRFNTRSSSKIFKNRGDHRQICESLHSLYFYYFIFHLRHSTNILSIWQGKVGNLKRCS